MRGWRGELAARALVANGVAGVASGGGRSNRVRLLRRGSREKPAAHTPEMPLAGERSAARRNASASRVLVGVGDGRRRSSSLLSLARLRFAPTRLTHLSLPVVVRTSGVSRISTWV